MVIGTKDGVFTDNMGWIMIACNLFRATYSVDDFNCVRSMVEPNTFIPRPHLSARLSNHLLATPLHNAF
jgi:hypothetical protein